MIEHFRDEHRWLSNFYPCIILFRGKRYPSVEYAYMSAKSDDKSWKRMCADTRVKQGEIKKKSRHLTLVANWDDIKVDVMRTCLELKFAQEPFKTWLLETGEIHLQEGNTWGDTFWGVDETTGEGQNMLGQLIMEIRQQIQSTDNQYDKS
ncbi:MAG: NADAR family protein [Saprospiraceae bacterium]|nr:NADAR family protein [Saprospiraceae bacterium]